MTQIKHLADFDRSDMNAGMLRGNLKGSLLVFGKNQVIAAEDFASFCKWTVRYLTMPISHSHAGGGCNWMQRRCAQILAMLVKLVR